MATAHNMLEVYKYLASQAHVEETEKEGEEAEEEEDGCKREGEIGGGVHRPPGPPLWVWVPNHYQGVDGDAAAGKPLKGRFYPSRVCALQDASEVVDPRQRKKRRGLNLAPLGATSGVRALHCFYGDLGTPVFEALGIRKVPRLEAYVSVLRHCATCGPHDDPTLAVALLVLLSMGHRDADDGSWGEGGQPRSAATGVGAPPSLAGAALERAQADSSSGGSSGSSGSEEESDEEGEEEGHAGGGAEDCYLSAVSRMLNEAPCIPTAAGGWAKLCDVAFYAPAPNTGGGMYRVMGVGGSVPPHVLQATALVTAPSAAAHVKDSEKYVGLRLLGALGCVPLSQSCQRQFRCEPPVPPLPCSRGGVGSLPPPPPPPPPPHALPNSEGAPCVDVKSGRKMTVDGLLYVPDHSSPRRYLP